MRGFRSHLLLLSLPLLLPSVSRAQTILFADDFENGTANWTMEPYWHLALEGPPCLDSTFPSGDYCMWYGIDASCNFDGPLIDFQDLRLAHSFTVPTNGGGTVLEFWSRAQVEGDTGWDWRRVDVSTNGGGLWTPVRWLLDTTEPWTFYSVDLSDYAGQTIDLRFTFWAGDTWANDFLGWQVDDVVLRTNINIHRLGCFGDGVAVACPCGNSSTPGAQVGCLNSLGTGGALRASGFASLSNDTLRLSGSGMTSTTVLYYQGGSQVNGGMGAPYGDGLTCVGGPIRRLGSTTNVGGASSFPFPGGESVSVRGQILAPGTRWYQARYRNSINFCTPDTFNSTNLVRVDWTL